MRKIFTLAAAVLASFSLWAQEPAVSLTAASTTIDEWNATYDNVTISVVGASFASKKPCGVTTNENAMSVSSSDSHWIEISCPDGLSRIVISGSGNSTGTTDWAAPLCVSESVPFDSTITSIIEVHYTGYDKACVENDIALPAGTKSVRLYRRMKVNTEGTKVGSGSNWAPASATGNQTYNITHVEAYAGGSVAPSTDPVSLVNIEGPTEGYVGKPVTFTLSTDAKATAYQWAVDLVEVEGANEKTFTFTPTEAKEYIITGQARNDYNEEDAWASDGHNFTAIEKPAATPCATLIPAAEGTNPAIGDKIILTEESFGGNIFVADMKAANDIKYNALGLLIGGGGKDSLRVELGHKIAVGTIISLKLAAAGTGNRGLKIQTLGHSTIFDASWSAAAAEELNAFEYEVKAGDKLIGESKFLLARNNSVYLQEVSVSDCGEELAPVTNPVTAVTVAGPETGFVGQTYSFKGTADADADDWIWYVNDIAVDGAKAATFAFTPDAVGTYRIMAGARNGYNPEDGWINSAEVSIVISEALEQVSVSASTEWDWTKAASVNEIKLDDSTTPKKNEEVLLANISGMNNNAEFNSQALLFSGEYPVRDGKYCQGSYLKFNTTVAGWVQLDFSNTGGKDGDRPKRYVAVNGVVNTEVGSDTGNKVESARIPVEAGNVEVAGAFEDGTAQYLRIYKLTFSTSDIAEGTENIDASAKAVKIIYNGQLLIKKGDVFYNAQGVVVK